MAVWVKNRYGIVNIEPCDEIYHRQNELGTWSVLGLIRQGLSTHEHVIADDCADEASANALVAQVFATLSQGSGATLDLTAP